MSNTNFKSLHSVSTWMKSIINRLSNLAPQFNSFSNEISNLALALPDLEKLLDQLKSTRNDLKIASVEKNKSIKNAITTTTTLIDRLKKDPNWDHDYEKLLKIHMMPLKPDVKMITKMSRTGVRFYSYSDCLKFMAWVKDFSHGLTRTDNLFRVYETDISNLQDSFEKAENAFNNYSFLYNRWATLSEEAAASVVYLRIAIRTVVKHLKASGNWTDDHTLLLGDDELPVPTNLLNFKPVVWLKAQLRHISVNFLKDGVDGMNVYTRLQGEFDFCFLGYAKRSPYRDPRPLLHTNETREYRLTGMAAGKEIGQQGDVVSINVAGKYIVKPVAWINIIDGYVCIHFRVKGKKGMNIYTRGQGESAFTFLGRSAVDYFRDPRPVVPGECAIREYRLNFIWVHTNKEFGRPGDIVSIKLG